MAAVRTRQEVQARREDLNRKLNAALADQSLAADPRAAITALAMQMHELDWVLGRNEG